MMAKMFYTLEEAKTALGRNEEEIKQLAREGRLREFRDGQKLMFKADQVDTLKSELGEGGGNVSDQLDLGPSDTGSPIGLVDSSSASAIGSGLGSGIGSALGGSGIGSGIGGASLGGSATGLSLMDSETRGASSAGSISGGSVAGSLGGGSLGGSLGGSPAGSLGGSLGGSPMGLKDDNDLASDLGLSGSLGGIPSPGRAAGGSGLSGLSSMSGIGSGGGSSGAAANSGSGSRSGINVLGSDDSQADPMAQTSISSSVGEQINMEGMGSGSGLLDLTRESDDTSLGAELLDEISPNTGGGRRPASIGDSSVGGVTASGATSTGRRGIVMPQQLETPDALAEAFGWAALAAVLFILYGALILCSALLHTKPPLADFVMGKPIAIVGGIGAGAAVVFFIIGLLIGKTTTR